MFLKTWNPLAIRSCDTRSSPTAPVVPLEIMCCVPHRQMARNQRSSSFVCVQCPCFSPCSIKSHLSSHQPTQTNPSPTFYWNTVPYIPAVLTKTRAIAIAFSSLHSQPSLLGEETKRQRIISATFDQENKGSSNMVIECSRDPCHNQRPVPTNGPHPASVSSPVTNGGNPQRDRVGMELAQVSNVGSATRGPKGNAGNEQRLTVRNGAVTGALNKGGPW